VPPAFSSVKEEGIEIDEKQMFYYQVLAGLFYLDEKPVWSREQHS